MRQSQNQVQRSGQCQTVDQEMDRFQLAVMTENNDSYYLQCNFVHMWPMHISDAFIQSNLHKPT